MFALIIVSVAFLFFVLKYIKQNRESPPGPWGLPIVGYYPFFGKSPLNDFERLAEKFGEIMNMTILGENFYILNSRELVTELLTINGHNLFEKPAKFNMLSHMLTEKAISNAHGEYFHTMYKFLIGKLSDLGMGKSDFESRIHDACDAVVKNIRNTNGKPFDAFNHLIHYAANVISLLAYSKNYDLNDGEFAKLQETSFQMLRQLDSWDGVLNGNIYHMIKRVQGTSYKKAIEIRAQLVEIMTQILRQRILDRDNNNDHDDVLTYFFNEMKGKQQQFFNYESLILIFIDLFIAGTETVAMTLYFALNSVGRDSALQNKIRDEIDQVIGRDRLVSYADRNCMHFTNSVIAEVMRYSILVPYVIRSNRKHDITLKDYKIPKGSTFIVNFYNVSRDKRYFKNPHSFDPSNFLDENGHFVNNEASMPFSLGKRKCLGAKLAETELFLLFVTLMQKFEFKIPEDEQPEVNTIDGLVRACSPFKICAIPR